MAILDDALYMAEAVAVTDAAKVLGDTIDLGAPGDGIPNNPLWRIRAAEAATAAGAASVTFELQTAEDEAFTVPVTLLSSGAIPKENLSLDAIAVELPIPRKGLLRYLRTYATPSAALTAGAFDSFIGY